MVIPWRFYHLYQEDNVFSLSETKINDAILKLETRNTSAGGFVCFEGWVRDHNQGKSVTKLAYEAYTQLAIKEGNRIIQEALDNYDIKKAFCTHRVGLLEIGDMAVWVGVSAAHRDAAFKACRFILDQVKARVPIWKNESWSNGESGWVEQEESN